MIYKLPNPKKMTAEQKQKAEQKLYENLNVAYDFCNAFLASNYTSLNDLHSSIDTLIHSVNGLRIINTYRRKSITIFGLTFSIEY